MKNYTGIDLAATIPARTMFAKKVTPVPTRPVAQSGLLVLKPSGNNSKLAAGDRDAVFTKGPWRGMPLFALTLQERATCPSSCGNWVRCFGNRMLNAKRYEHGPALEAAVERDVRVLAVQHPDGFVVRLHILGDFYSVQYVEVWHRLVRQIPQLHVYGYTHREFGTTIGDAVTRLVTLNRGRVSILRSDATAQHDPLPCAMTVAKDAVTPHPASQVICPEQTGRTTSCLTCGLCMNGRTSVSFVDHGTIPHKLIALGRARSQEVA